MNFLQFLLEPSNWMGTGGILVRIGQHLIFTGISVVVAAVIAIPLGILIGHTGWGNFLVIGLSNAARAVPTLGLLVLIVLLLGTGPIPLILVLTILAIPPIMTATAAGVAGADPEAVHAARALGMTGGQVVRGVEVPLALPLMISGLRSASLQVVATATVAAYVTLGGLGRLLFDGLRTNDYPQVIAGAILVAALAILLDIILGTVGWFAGRHARPRSKTAVEAVPTTT